MYSGTVCKMYATNNNANIRNVLHVEYSEKCSEGKFSNPKILNVLKCIAEEILRRFIAVLSKFYTVNILHYTGILVNNVDELFRLCM